MRTGALAVLEDLDELEDRLPGRPVPLGRRTEAGNTALFVYALATASIRPGTWKRLATESGRRWPSCRSASRRARLADNGASGSIRNIRAATMSSGIGVAVWVAG